MIQRLRSIGYKAAMVGTLALTAGTVRAEDACDLNGGIGAGAACAAPPNAQTDLFGSNGIFQQISNTLIFLVGAIAVIMLIIGGLRYVTSNGEAASIKGAKDTITYAIIGIIVAILAFAAVHFVIGRFTGGAA